MKIINFGIKNGRQHLTFQRENMQEEGKMDTRYAIWQDKTGVMVFGIVNAQAAHGHGISIKDNKELIENHLTEIINSRKLRFSYFYISAPAEPCGEGCMQELILPPLEDTKQLSDEYITIFKKILNMISHL